MSQLKKKRCPICTKEIEMNEKTTTCPQCGVVHHAECWENNSGCCTKGCIAAGNTVKDIKSIASMQHKNHSQAPKRPEPLKTPVQMTPPPVQRHTPPVHHQPPKQAPKLHNDGMSTVHKKRDSLDSTPLNFAPTACGYDMNGNMDEYMEILIQKNIPYYDHNFSVMNQSGSSVSWNWPAFFFGINWMLYRKMYLNAVLFYLISSVMPFLVLVPYAGLPLFFIAGIAIWLFMGMFSNTLYKSHLEKHYTNGEGLSHSQRKQYCYEKGGTSVVAVILCYVIGVVISSIITSIMLLTIGSSFFYFL